MEESKIEIQNIIVQNEKITYEALIEYDIWYTIFQNYYNYFLNIYTKDIKINGFRKRENIPEILISLKYPELFDNIKKEASNFFLEDIILLIGKQQGTKPQMNNFLIEEDTNILKIFCEENVKVKQEEVKQEEI
jgi:hypothetical protein